ncbi:MAG: protein-L-isoaspartate O-methyltransferase [Candidatus Zambryskibacteria bacterium CG10_big_fil_rev_8_21_14_0_10_42_12]|uniref:Protein-L-isoaspartate O-methyltransferase n=1 Tax=Candidatus Zambryskibacteria bacterium CG10_big_fil_rev_8_21_14_0_10_42_12 TaxID=1975115 RepID=A0A2H0QVS9_9BACT|nr:MAG: protein-L-isoaspartate O-methyltransferase [Candidatus Zambryskibacteria bacterium CG10_big_fil_rev_8_21_14_0_10_42_12]
MEEDFASKKKLIDRLEHSSGVLKNPRIKEAFETVDRADFVFGDYKIEAYEDYALPMTEGSTISQPTIVAFMLELLDLQSGESVLEVGSGSGFVLALMSYIVGEAGNVYGTEINTELLLFSDRNIQKYPELSKRIHNMPATGELGLIEDAPYDKILVSADLPEIPSELVGQLTDGGILVCPVKGEMLRIQKKDDSYEVLQSFPGFSFVPVV